MHARIRCLGLVAIVVAIAAGRVAAQENKDAAKTKSTVAVFRLRGPIVEKPTQVGFSLFGGATHSLPLSELVERMAKARDDEAVKAVVLTLDGATINSAQIEEVRQSMAALRAAKKDVYLFADGLSMLDYALAAGATEVTVVPTGDLWLTGFYAESPYVRGLLNKIGVAPDFLTCGDYKSAAEMFMREGPSPHAEEMQNWLLDSMYQTVVQLIAAGRGLEESKVRQWIDGGPYTAARAKELGIIDRVAQREELEAALKQKYGDNAKFDHKYAAKTSGQLDLSSPMGIMSFYAELLGGRKKKAHKDSVAIVYVDGAIVLGSEQANPLGFGSESASSTAIRRALDEAAEDNSIKAVVLRVDSPGGSATASDIILAATKRVKAKKPFVVSMGNVAGSGGYYVACGSDLIFADRSTITGSIGVVGGKLATSGLWSKIGIQWKAYARGANAAILSTARPFTDAERARMQAWMDEIYGVFKDHVTEIRGSRLKKEIDQLAGGRVYTGQQALELGLVDRIGTLTDAIHYVAEQAKIDKYEIRAVPEPKSFFETLLGGLTGGDEDDAKGVSLEGLKARGGNGLLEAALPYLEQLDGPRVRAIATALGRLEMIRREGAVLMMPEIVVGP
ncbi:MAG: signal peptide peptidase SppA [Planctomycetia bacterium]|nr:signal peptide peptidase SppA [Planctomycetia bacterium]